MIVLLCRKIYQKELSENCQPVYYINITNINQDEIHKFISVKIKKENQHFSIKTLTSHFFFYLILRLNKFIAVLFSFNIILVQFNIDFDTATLTFRYWFKFEFSFNRLFVMFYFNGLL